ncbi:MAG: pyrimidine reductase family protein [Acidimicrobiales bacterium]
MRQVLPVALDPVDPLAAYAEVPAAREGRPWVRVNMVASVDGATEVGGRSGGLGGHADRHLFQVLRSLADVVLVGASTARTEHYGPARLTADLRESRRRRSVPPTPPLAVVTRSCELDWESPFFTQAKARPVVVTVDEAPAAQRARAAEVADVILAGRSTVDLALALDALGRQGVRSVTCEGGPVLNGGLVDAGRLDELDLTVSPVLAGGDAKRLLWGASLVDPGGLELRSVCEEDGFLFLRYLAAGRP